MNAFCIIRAAFKIPGAQDMGNSYCLVRDQSESQGFPVQVREPMMKATSMGYDVKLSVVSGAGYCRERNQLFDLAALVLLASGAGTKQVNIKEGGQRVLLYTWGSDHKS